MQKKRKGLGRLLQKVGNFFKNLWVKTEPGLKKIVEVTYSIIEQLKDPDNALLADVATQIINKVIPGDADDKLVAKVRAALDEWIPKVLFEAEFLDTLLKETDRDARLRMIIEKIQSWDENKRFKELPALAGRMVEYLSDGELTKYEAADLMRMFFINVEK